MGNGEQCGTRATVWGYVKLGNLDLDLRPKIRYKVSDMLYIGG